MTSSNLALFFCAPLSSELAFEGVFEYGLAVDFELLAGGFQGFDAFVQLGEQGFDFGDDAVLFVYWRQIQIYFLEVPFVND